MRRIVIEEGSAGPSATVGNESSGLDLQDWLILGGIVLSEAAALVIWWPSGLILGAVWCLGFAHLIEKEKTGKNGSSRS